MSVETCGFRQRHSHSLPGLSRVWQVLVGRQSAHNAPGLMVASLRACNGCRARLRDLAALLRALDVENGGHTAAADLVLLYASTQTWFASEREYKVHAPACALLAKPSLMLPSQGVWLPTHVDLDAAPSNQLHWNV